MGLRRAALNPGKSPARMPTPTLKLKRNNLVGRFEREIERLYER